MDGLHLVCHHWLKMPQAADGDSIKLIFAPGSEKENSCDSTDNGRSQRKK